MITIDSRPESSPVTSSSAARSAPEGTVCTIGATSPTSRTSAIRLSKRVMMAPSSSRSTPNTGGRVSVHTVSEQLVYEMGDPHEYITPDVIADFTTIKLAQDGTNRVRVSGIRGAAPTDKLKVSIAYRAGFKAVGTLVYSWPDALEKAQLADRILRERLDRLGLRFDEILTEFVGASATHGALAGDAGRQRARGSASRRRPRS